MVRGRGTALERAIERLDIGLCWEWKGPLDRGYGVIWADGRARRVHIVVWTALVGPVPEGLVLDHLCRNKSCANPDHLEPVTQRVNVARNPVKEPPGFRERNPG